MPVLATAAALGTRYAVRSARKAAVRKLVDDTEDSGSPCFVTWTAVERRMQELRNIDEDIEEQLNTIDSEGNPNASHTQELMGSLEAEQEKIDDVLRILRLHLNCVQGR